MAETAEVAIVGGGIAGCATAYLLSKRGVQVTLIEREAIGSCASGFAAGLINPLDGRGIHSSLEPLAQHSFRMHLPLTNEIKAETGIDPEWQPMLGVWIVINESETQGFLELFHLSQRLEGLTARWLEGPELRSLESRVSPHAIRAMLVEGISQVTSYKYTLALAQAAEKYGATVRHGTVQGLRRSNGRVSAVVLSDGEMACGKVILAMGPWTGEVEGWLGIPMPIMPLKGQILHLQLDGPPLEYVFFRSGGGYFSAKSDGLIWAGTTEERVGFDHHLTQEARKSIIEGTVAIMPSMSEAQVVLQTACLRPVFEDGLPVIGEVSGCEGLYVVTGAGRNGILLAPAMAQAVADLITSGQTDLPIEPLAPDRFVNPKSRQGKIG